MGLWAQVLQLPIELMRQVQEMYGPRFPIEVRHCIAPWIEAQPWRELDEDCEGSEQVAAHLFHEMLQQIRDKAASLNSEELYTMKFRLIEAADQMQMMYSGNAFECVRIIKNGLMREEQLLRLSRGGDAESRGQEPAMSDTERVIVTEIHHLKRMTEATAEELRQQQNGQESFIIQYQENARVTQSLQQLAAQQAPGAGCGSVVVGHIVLVEDQVQKLKAHKQRLEVELRQKACGLRELRKNLQDKHLAILQKFDQVMQFVLQKELPAWQGMQRAATYRAGMMDNQMLNKIQRWCEELATILSESRQQIVRVEQLRSSLPMELNPDRLPQLKAHAQSLLTTLLARSFVVDHQPPQVLKKDARFTATVRLLVGHKLNIFMNLPQVEATIINEQQARKVIRENMAQNIGNAGDILNCKGVMEFNQGQLSVTFRNMALKRIKRADRKGQELVVEEKFCILFRSMFRTGSSEDLQYDIFALSLPIVVTVHGNQECQAQATVLWDNAFSEPGRQPFIVPDCVPWQQLAEMLAHWFHSRTGAALSPDNLYYLATKLFGQEIEDFTGLRVSRALFHKDQLQPGRHFTFWEWLYGVQKVTKEFLRPLWCDRLIVGFASKRRAQDMLMSRPPGTFLLRYSDSECGGITIAYVADDGKGEKQIMNLAPFQERDFKIRGLADRVKDLPQLRLLYPDLPKETTFGKYWSRSDDEKTPSSDGYIRTVMVNTIPGTPTASLLLLPSPYDYNPQTPRSGICNPQSPQSTIAASPASMSSIHTLQSVTSPADNMEDDLFTAYGVTDDVSQFNVPSDDMGQQINLNEFLPDNMNNML